MMKILLMLEVLVELLLPLKRNVFTDAHSCNVKVGPNKELIAECLEQSTIPQDLRTSLKKLTVKNSDVEIKAGDFKRYVNLNELYLGNLNIQGDLSPNILRPLINLKSFLFINVLPENPFNLYLPESLTLVKIADNKRITNLDFSHLKNLKELHLDNLSLNSLPKVDPQIPLTFLSLLNNPLKNLTREDIVPFCLLKEISLSIDDNNMLRQADNYCQCLLLEDWLRDIGIAIVNATDLSCTVHPTINSPNQCKKPVPMKILEEHEKCLNRREPSSGGGGSGESGGSGEGGDSSGDGGSGGGASSADGGSGGGASGSSNGGGGSGVNGSGGKSTVLRKVIPIAVVVFLIFTIILFLVHNRLLKKSEDDKEGEEDEEADEESDE